MRTSVRASSLPVLFFSIFFAFFATGKFPGIAVSLAGAAPEAPGDRSEGCGRKHKKNDMDFLAAGIMYGPPERLMSQAWNRMAASVFLSR
jgi:hypothetical protein